ncbi:MULTISPECIES: DciA family protein [unclassified Streptomyces]|uniref:DciA family protein n=1 Tax=unclassified Streptomyces TaxID=2593676 RepID=UPI002E166B6D|nr:DciA family protein [Streptomyces sp. NBC_01240]
MNETTTPIEQPAIDSPELSGVDLARVALHQAREAAKKRGDSEARAPRRRRTRVVQREGREPSGFAAVLQGLMADRAWELPAAGGTVLDRWPEIAAAVAPQLPDQVQAVAFHPETGELDLRPDSPAYATQLRLISARIAAAVNDGAGTQVVRSIRVLAVGAMGPAPRETATAPSAVAPEMLVKTREMASAGFQQTLAAHQGTWTDRHVDQGIAEAVERQTRAMRELSRRAFPEPEAVPDDQPAPIEAAAVVQRRRNAEATRALALRRARAERAQRAGAVATMPSAHQEMAGERKAC